MSNQEQLDAKLKEIIVHNSDNNFVVRYLTEKNRNIVKKYIDDAKELLEYGANPNTKNDIGQTILHLYIIIVDRIHDKELGDIAPFSLIDYLLEKGADVNVADNEGKTPLHMVSAYGYIDLIKLFLEKGADLEAVDMYGNNAADYTIMEKQITAKVELESRGLKALKRG